MGRSKAAKQKANSTKADIAEVSVAASTSAAPPGHSPSDLLDRAEANLASGQADGLDLARKFAVRASEILAHDGEHDAIQQARAGEVLGMCALEHGDEDEAREIFTAISGVSSTALLYLAQLALSPLDAIKHFQGAIDILSASLGDSIAFTSGSTINGKDRSWSDRERGVRTEITKALVSMTELYLTDLCMEEDAEICCEQYLNLALRMDEGADINPEIYSTLASVRMSQMRNEEAKVAMDKAFSSWRDLPLDHPAVPSYVARLTLARLFIEVDSYLDALEVLEGLEDEDEFEPEVLYLIGLVNWLLGEQEVEVAVAKHEHCLDSREALERFLQLHARTPAETDPAMLQQVQELIQQLEERGITQKLVDDRAERLERDAARPNGTAGDTDMLS